ncbi:hypothetical protein NIES4075_47090 [Tolypothrix sp. NIES-4075]|nr:hypothetical protein NIES4075_47090 [Tolypothrix sp. NIES-4075]
MSMQSDVMLMQSDAMPMQSDVMLMQSDAFKNGTLLRKVAQNLSRLWKKTAYQLASIVMLKW